MVRVLTLVAAVIAAGSFSLAGRGEPTTVPAGAVKLPAKEKVRVFLLVGQSNMAGRGKVEAEDKKAHPRVVTLTKANTWAPAVDPIHFDKPAAGVGLGTTFGKVLAEKFPEDTIALVPAAVGGTSIDKWNKGGELYTNAVTRAKLAMKEGHLAGILWHQGESDSGKPDTYAAKAQQLFADLRRDLDAPDVPVVVGLLGEFRPASEKINAVIKKLPETIPNSACADSAGLKDRGDSLHFDSAACREFGRRYAAAWVGLVEKKK